MKKYDPKEFIEAFGKHINGRDIPDCPYCGGQKFTSTDKFASIIIGDDTTSVNLGPSIPSGMLICSNCGHIEFFALGALGLLNNNENGGSNND